jgi:hypothetical protein
VVVGEVFEVMTQVDLGLTNVSRFDSAYLVISVNDANLKTWGVTSPAKMQQLLVYKV